MYRATSMCSEMESMSHRCWITLWYMKETILEPFPPLHQKKMGHSRSMCFQTNCWYYRQMLKYHKEKLNSCISLLNVVKALFDFIWPSVYRATSMCSEMESMSHRCWITRWYMKETILEPFPPLHQKKMGHSRSMCFQTNCWYYRQMLKYQKEK